MTLAIAADPTINEPDRVETADEDTGVHELPSDIELAEMEAEGKEPTYRIVCDFALITREADTGLPLTSLKQARARLARITSRIAALGDRPDACQRKHLIQKRNTLGFWDEVAGRSARATSRGIEIIIPALPNQRAPKYAAPSHGHELTATDFFCGAGGSSSGIEMVPGMRVTMASNHWALAIATHNHNLPHADHDQADLALVDPRRYPKTDIGWFSPECTKWSQARGKKVDYDTKALKLTQETLFDPDLQEDPETPEDREAVRRSRALMGDVIRFSMYHQYKGVIVENVTDILQWAFLPEWLKKMSDEGYDYKVIVLNSAFANKLGAAPPQLRDRVYFMFWKRRYRKPNFAKWLRVKAWCDSCLEVVDGEYTEKPGKPRAMRYGQQYYYRCLKVRCKGRPVRPFARPASSVIDYTLPSQRIGDRPRPLKPKTYARVEAGLERWEDTFLAAMAGNTWERKPGVRTYPIGAPMPTQTTALSLGMIVPAGGTWNDTATPAVMPSRATTTTENGALLVPVEGRTGLSARSDGDLMRAQTGRLQDALVELPPDEGMIVPLRNNGVPRHTQDVLPAFAAGGYHHALVMPMRKGAVPAPADKAAMSTFTTVEQQALVEVTRQTLITRHNNTRGDQGYLSTSDSEPTRAFTTAGHQSVLEFDVDGLYTYDTGLVRPATVEPMPAQTTVDGDAVLRGPRVSVNDCTLRMLAVKEIQAGMAFPDWFTLLGNAKRNKVRMLGNAVTANAARDLMGCLFEAITGIEQQTVEFDPFKPLF